MRCYVKTGAQPWFAIAELLPTAGAKVDENGN
jgi:hypothetical protein